ncbi:hypothetical protein [Levilactobacillus senmaizukei]|nr:hypothetical protein [Levilactobacillus senmaizukei]
MQTNWKKTTITFLLGTDAVHPVKIAMANAVADPTAKQVEDFGNTLSGLTGLPFLGGLVTVQNVLA